MRKFNSKEYRQKKRVYVKVPRANLVTRLFCWDKYKNEYCAPISGKLYYARRYDIDTNNKKLLKGQYFNSLDEARAWQQQAPLPNPTKASFAKIAITSEHKNVDNMPTLRQIYEEWKGRRFSALTNGTQRNYERYIRIHFQELLDIKICDITSRIIDEWIDARKAAVAKSSKARQRIAFKHELSTLRVLLKYFSEYYDHIDFRMPLKDRHIEAARVRRRVESKPKDLTEEEFWRFHKALCQQKHGRIFATLAVVQYFQALRICEAAAIQWENVHIDRRTPSNSRLRIIQHIEFPRIAGGTAVIVPGLKNDNGKSAESIKEQPLFPEPYQTLTEYCAIGGRGIIFTIANNQPLSYRQIQKAYDTAFIVAKLPYSGTHVLRHGGTRRIYNETGDLAVAQQLLGNSDLGSTLVYAKRQKDALTKVAAQHWGRHNNKGGRLAEFQF